MSDYEYLRGTPWETRNLGLQSFEVQDTFTDSPDLSILTQDMARATRDFGRIFIHARIAKSALPAARFLGQAGFYFIETGLIPYTIFKKNSILTHFVAKRDTHIPSRHDGKDLKVVRLHQIDEHACTVLRDIARESFTDDRFHLDCNCPKEAADERFCNWIDDLAGDDAIVFYIMEASGEEIAFMARKADKLILAGFSPHHVKSGYGDFFWLSVLEDMLAEGLSQATTMISANNTSVINLYARMGFKFKNPCASFHYWSDCCKEGIE